MHEPAKSRQNASEAEFDTGVMPWMWLPLYRCQNQAAWPYLVHRIPWLLLSSVPMVRDEPAVRDLMARWVTSLGASYFPELGPRRPTNGHCFGWSAIFCHLISCSCIMT